MNTRPLRRGLATAAITAAVPLALAAPSEAETIYGLDTSNNVLTFDSADPATITANNAITGLQPGENVARDRRPPGRPASSTRSAAPAGSTRSRRRPAPHGGRVGPVHARAERDRLRVRLQPDPGCDPDRLEQRAEPARVARHRRGARHRHVARARRRGDRRRVHQQRARHERDHAVRDRLGRRHPRPHRRAGRRAVAQRRRAHDDPRRSARRRREHLVRLLAGDRAGLRRRRPSPASRRSTSSTRAATAGRTRCASRVRSGRCDGAARAERGRGAAVGALRGRELRGRRRTGRTRRSPCCARAICRGRARST